LAIGTTVNAQFIQLPRNFIVASWDNLIPTWMGKTNRYGSAHFILVAMLIVGVVPLLAGLDIGAIARAATISAILPAFIIYWVITRIPKKFPAEYEKGLFKLKPFWLWLFFVLSEISMLMGVVLLSRDLSKPVLATLSFWLILSVIYYPIRKRCLKKKGFDLDASTTDPGVMQINI
jgi:APA family basic amino acid/polyamine antiporter